LGVWGKGLLEGDGALDPVQSALLFLTFFLLVIVGTLAAQVNIQPCMINILNFYIKGRLLFEAEAY
jgi:hypothetical protein